MVHIMTYKRSNPRGHRDPAKSRRGINLTGNGEVLLPVQYFQFVMSLMKKQIEDWIAPLVLWAAVMSTLTAVVAVLLGSRS
jgi:hypothetical protein